MGQYNCDHTIQYSIQFFFFQQLGQKSKSNVKVQIEMSFQNRLGLVSLVRKVIDCISLDCECPISLGSKIILDHF